MAVGVAHGWNYGWVLLLALPVAGLYVRLFILQHDCGHGSFFSSPAAERRRRARSRRGDADAVWLLAEHPRDPSRDVGQPRPSRDRRHRHADRERIRGGGLVEARRLSLLPQHAGAARPRTAVPVRAQASPAARPAARPPEGMGQRLAQQCRAGARPSPRCRWRSAGRRCCSCTCRSCSCRGRPASGCSTCSTSSRTPTGTRSDAWSIERSALAGSSYYDLPRGPALVQRQHRLPPPASHGDAHSELPAARVLRLGPAAAAGSAPDALDQPAVRTPAALGRAERNAWSRSRRARRESSDADSTGLAWPRPVRPGPRYWWRRRESNPRPQALRYRFYVRVQPIDLAPCYPVGGENTKPASERFSGSSPEHTGSAIL